MSYWMDVPRARIEDLVALISEVLFDGDERNGNRFLSDVEVMELRTMKDEFEALLDDRQLKFARWFNRTVGIGNSAAGESLT